MDIKPSQYKILKPFEAWVQQTLPAIYDDSLSYTDLLAKLLYYVNTLSENNTTLSNDVTNAINYINNYFENLDVQDEINNKLDQMVENGTMQEIFSTYFNFITPERFGCIGDGETDDTENFKKFIAYLKQNNVSGYCLTSKTYLLSKQIDITKCSINFNKSTIKAKEGFNGSSILYYQDSVNTTEDYTHFTVIEKLSLDCNNIPNLVGILMPYVFKCTLRDCMIYNCCRSCLKVTGGAELFVDECHLIGNRNYQQYGIEITTSDCHFTNIVIIDCHTAIYNEGSNFYSLVHGWKSKNIKGSVFMLSHSGYCQMSQCSIDTYETGIYIQTDRGVIFDNGTYFNNNDLYDSDVFPTFLKYTNSASYYSQKTIISNSEIRSNVTNKPLILISNNNTQTRMMNNNYIGTFNNDDYKNVNNGPLILNNINGLTSNEAYLKINNNMIELYFDLSYTNALSSSSFVRIANIDEPLWRPKTEVNGICIGIDTDNNITQSIAFVVNSNTVSLNFKNKESAPIKHIIGFCKWPLERAQ